MNAQEMASVERAVARVLDMFAEGIERARALGNGGEGETIRVVNLQSNRTIEAVITGPGSAAVNGQ